MIVIWGTKSREKYLGVVPGEEKRDAACVMEGKGSGAGGE